MIDLRERLAAHRTSLRLILLLATVLGALVWAHSGAEAHAMTDDSMESAMTICLAVVNAGTALVAGVALLARPRHRRDPHSGSALVRGHAAAASTGLSRPPPRAGPARLQVFLR